MLFKEKKPNEYTAGRGRQEHTETDTHHKAQAGRAQAAAWWREPRARQAALGQLTLALGTTGQGWGGATRQGEHGILQRRDQDQQNQPRGPGEQMPGCFTNSSYNLVPKF